MVTGSAGRIGRVLRVIWGETLAGAPVLWSIRKPAQGTDIVWDISKNDAPVFPEGTIFLHLAGKIRGDAEALAENRRLTLSLCKVAEATKTSHVVLMSSAAVYGPSTAPIPEAQRPDPGNDYGRAKWQAELAAQNVLPPGRLTILRLGNLAGADALLSGAHAGPVVLDRIEGQPGGPERSYIGPRALADVLRALIVRLQSGGALPPVLNVAQPPALAMADLLRAAGADWRFGPPRAAATPRVELSVDLLTSLVTVPEATAASVVQDLISLRGAWP